MGDRAFAALLATVAVIPLAAVMGYLAAPDPPPPSPPAPVASVSTALHAHLKEVSGASQTLWWWVPGPGSTSTDAQEAQLMISATPANWKAVEALGYHRKGSRYIKATCSTWNDTGKSDPFTVGAVEAAQYCRMEVVSAAKVRAHFRPKNGKAPAA